MKESSQYEKIVNWYNLILDKASQAKDNASNVSKEAAINTVLTDCLSSLWKSVNQSYVLDDATQSEIVNISHRMSSEGVDKFRRKGQKGEFVHNVIQGIKSIFGKSPSAFFEAQFIAASKLGSVNTALPEDLTVSAPRAVAAPARAAPAPIAPAAQSVPVDPIKERMRKLAAAAGNSAAQQKVMELRLNPEESAAARDLQQGGDGKGLSKASQGAWASRRGKR